jgi:hypothetical protein
VTAHRLSCGHTNQTDLTGGYGNRGPNVICHVCGMHWYKGREWTRTEWAAYVEDYKAEPILSPCKWCDERCDAYPCVNANPKGLVDIDAAKAAKE